MHRLLWKESKASDECLFCLPSLSETLQIFTPRHEGKCPLKNSWTNDFHISSTKMIYVPSLRISRDLKSLVVWRSNSEPCDFNRVKPVFFGESNDLVGGFNPVEKYLSKWESFPNRSKNKKCLKEQGDSAIRKNPHNSFRWAVDPWPPDS